MRIEILGGKDEIGGNKILLEHKSARIFLDFGMSFKQAGLYFSEFLQPRKCAGLSDFFELGLLPDIKGLYRGDYLRHMGREEEEKTQELASFCAFRINICCHSRGGHSFQAKLN